MIELQVDRGDGPGWQLLAMDTTPGYKDTHSFPPAATAGNLARSSASAINAWGCGVMRWGCMWAGKSPHKSTNG